MDWKRLFFSGKGRIGRRDFWIATLLIACVTVPLRLLGEPGNLLACISLFPHICVLAKRLHDRGWSGWFAGAPFIASLIAGVLTGLAPDDGQGPTGDILWLAAAFNIAGVASFFWIGLARGDAGANRYGQTEISFLRRADQNAGRIA